MYRCLVILGQVDSALDLPASHLVEVVRLCQRWDVPAAALLEGLGLDEAALLEPARRVPLTDCARVLERAVELTGEPALAVHLGRQMRLSSHGFVGFAAGAATTLGEALALAERFGVTRTAALGVRLHVEGERASLVIEERGDLGRLRETAVLALMIGLWQIGEALTGTPLDGVGESALPRPAYADRAGLERIRFDRPAHRMIFPAALLSLPLVSADPVAMELARQQCERELRAVVDAGLVGRVRRALADGDGVRPLPAVARALGLSTRTLKRKLAGHGTRFSALADDHRRQRALLLIEDRGLGLAEIAERVGYTEVANFTRAFRRWTGATPAAYRARKT